MKIEKGERNRRTEKRKKERGNKERINRNLIRIKVVD
jgi:hypothetical protein